MTDKPSVTKGSPDLPDALDKREFSVARKGYDKSEVRAFLAEIEANFRDLEKWAEQTKARLAIAEENDSKDDEVDQIMVAAFDAKQRVLERARLQGRKIEADASERAAGVEADARERAAAIEADARGPADVDEAAAALLADAERRSAEILADADRRVTEIASVIDGMIEVAQAATIPEESILETARSGADRLIQYGRGEATTLVEKATRNVEESEALKAGFSDSEVEVMGAAVSEAATIAEQQDPKAEETRRAADQEAAELERSELDEITGDQQVGSERLAQRIFEMEAAEQEEAERSRVDDDEGGTPGVADDEEDGAGERTRYERKSAKLPSMGEDASKVVGSLEGFRKSLRGA